MCVVVRCKIYNISQGMMAVFSRFVIQPSSSSPSKGGKCTKKTSEKKHNVKAMNNLSLGTEIFFKQYTSKL